MSDQPVVLYEVADRVARITLNRPERGNGITPALVAGLVECVREADLDPAVHVLLLGGAGSGFCGGYDLVESAEGMGSERGRAGALGRACGLADRPGGDGRESRPERHVGPDARLRDDEPQRAGLHEPVRAAASRSSARCTGSASPAAPTWRCARTCS